MVARPPNLGVEIETNDWIGIGHRIDVHAVTITNRIASHEPAKAGMVRPRLVIPKPQLLLPRTAEPAACYDRGVD
jgi:hypothetical protein